MTTSELSLSDRYTHEVADVFMTGLHAIARLPIEQLIVDQRSGLRTAAYATGYPGSPVGNMPGIFDEAFRIRNDLPLIHRMSLNEEYAATAVMGTQLSATRSDARYDGVIGLWYGKAPGVDRALDALRHGSLAGASQHGGVVCIAGDDPGAKSSTLPSSSAGVLSDLHIPVLYPGTPAEALDLGRHAIAMSRTTGLWTALKIVADVADGSGSVALDPDRVVPKIPLLDGRPYLHLPDGLLLAPHSLEIEREIYAVRFPLAIEYVRLNRLNDVTVGSSDARIGIVASGITYGEVREALRMLGLRHDDDIRRAGLRLYKMLMPLPFDAGSMREFADGLDEIIVVEEKNPNVETLVKDALYSLPNRPTVVGKFDDHDQVLFPGYGMLVADGIAPRLRSRLAPKIGQLLAPPPPPPRERIRLEVERAPFYCSGCPHNRSTAVPSGTAVGVGIGCHSLVLLMDRDRVGDLVGLTPMGNEGMQWVGMAPFVETDHIVQNLGDGTFFHSGQLAVPAAVASGVNLTYKLLFNDAIGMTGGQSPTGRLEVERICRQLLNQGVGRIIITTDHVENYASADLPQGAEVWPRTRLEEAHQALADENGVTVLLHDQHCAAEARRLRKKGLMTTPTQRIVINHRVCEGCGDCGKVSNCLSVQPLDTDFGRKTRIDQTTCNLDYSCLEGECPSFVVVETKPKLRRIRKRRPRRQSSQLLRDLLEHPLSRPERIVDVDDLRVRLVGVGGTGVVTVAQVLGTAAQMDGLVVRGLDQTGMSQKAGPVTSDLRFSREEVLASSRIGDGHAHVLIALDQLVAASEVGLRAVSRQTVVVGSSSPGATGAMIGNPTLRVPTPEVLIERIAANTDDARQWWADAAAITSRLLGNAVTANMFVVGMAVQAGALPIAIDKIEDAIRLNGAAVDQNLKALALGRLFVSNRDAVLGAVNASVSRTHEADVPWIDQSLNDMQLDEALSERARRYAIDLLGWGPERHARRYATLVAEASAADLRMNAAGRFVGAVIDNAYRLMSYKDEYEVARLLLLDDAYDDAFQLAGERGRISFALQPPLLQFFGVRTKIKFGEATHPMLKVLAALRMIRGTPFDIFGWTRIRRVERQLRDDYELLIRKLSSLDSDTVRETAVRLAAAPEMIRGYESVKMRNIEAYQHHVAELLND